MFYYMLHIVLLHAVSEVVYSEKTGTVTIVRAWFGPQALNIGLPLDVPGVDGGGGVAVSAVSLVLRGVKASTWGRQQGWLSYL